MTEKDTVLALTLARSATRGTSLVTYCIPSNI